MTHQLEIKRYSSVVAIADDYGTDWAEALGQGLVMRGAAYVDLIRVPDGRVVAMTTLVDVRAMDDARAVAQVFDNVPLRRELTK